ncbi:hypothetical protein [Tsukamurella hominis]|uniref:hypothetical protein n=1 Tax=Tsukamurella hominis TaxID=1970232 RepID=UPI0039E770EB
MHGITEADGRRILDDYSRSHAEQTPSAFTAYLHDLNRTAAAAAPGEPWCTPVPADGTSPADTATAEPHGPGNGTAATAAEPGSGDGEEPDTGTSVESAVLDGTVSAARSPVGGPESAEGARGAPNAGESLTGAHSAERGTGGRAGRGGRGSTTPEERQQRALALMHTMTEDSQAAAMQRGRTRVQKYLDDGPQTEGQIRDRFKGSTFATGTGDRINAPLLVPVFLADLVTLGQITQQHDGRYHLATNTRRSA